MVISASMVSAKEPIVKTDNTAIAAENNAQAKRRVCVDVLTSCGKKAVACGENTAEIVENALLADALSCP